MRIAFILCTLPLVLFATPDKTVGAPLPLVDLQTDTGKTLSLVSLKGKPLILSPIFATCPHTCTPITRGLLKATDALKKKGFEFNVLSLSFDPSDGPATLSALRKKVGLPADWQMAYGKPETVKAVLDTLDFQVARMDDGGFSHPNLVVVLTPELRVAKHVYGTDFHADELELALEEASHKSPWAKYSHLGITAALAALAGLVYLASRK